MDSLAKYISTGILYSATWTFHWHTLFLKVIVNKQSRHYEQELKEQVGSVGIIPSTFTSNRVCKDENLIIATRSTTLILESSLLRAKHLCETFQMTMPESHQKRSNSKILTLYLRNQFFSCHSAYNKHLLLQTKKPFCLPTKMTLHPVFFLPGGNMLT